MGKYEMKLNNLNFLIKNISYKLSPLYAFKNNSCIYLHVPM